MYAIYYKHFTCECKICGRNITNKSNLKRHLSEQHDLIDIDREVPRESLPIFPCHICMNQFKRKSTLIEHMVVHKEKRLRYEYDQCEETFYSVNNLRSHQKIVFILTQFGINHINHVTMSRAIPFVSHLLGNAVIFFELAVSQINL